jgi:hypothetical protein
VIPELPIQNPCFEIPLPIADSTDSNKNGDVISAELRERWNAHFKVLRLVDSPKVEHVVKSISIKESEYMNLINRAHVAEAKLAELNYSIPSDMEMKNDQE